MRKHQQNCCIFVYFAKMAPKMKVKTFCLEIIF